MKNWQRWKKKFRKGIVAVIVISLTSCGLLPSKKPQPPSSMPSPPTSKPYCVFGKCYFPLASAEGYVEEGLASWYGPNFHGKRTSSGEIFDMNDMTAAHKILPLGTYVKVTRLDTNQWIIVRINDRGPFVNDRVIDLSKRAAEALGIVGKGLARVRIEALQSAELRQYAQNQYIWVPKPMPPIWKGKFEIQLAAFENPQNAQRFSKTLSRRYANVSVVPFYNREKLFYRVRIGTFEDLHKAQSVLESIRKEFPDAFVVAQEEQKT